MYESGGMAPAAYTYLMDLTYKWYLADPGERQDIEDEANRFRDSGYTHGDNEYYNELIEEMSARPGSDSITQDQHYFRNKLNLQFSWSDFQTLQERLPDYLQLEELASVFEKGFHMYQQVY